MKTFIYTTLLGLLTLVLRAEPSISAELNPAEITVGQSALLTLRVHDARGGSRPALPQVKDLQITPAGQSSQFRMGNGTSSSTITYNYQCTPQKSGDYEIPSVTVIHKGQILKTPAFRLRAVASGSSTVSPQVAPAPADKELAYLHILREELADRDHLYVGETIPIGIRAYIREGLQVSGLNKPILTNQAYTLESLSKEPRQERKTIDGVRYLMLTWYGGLTGVKAGEHPLKAELKATLGVPQKTTTNNNRRQRGGGFDDPFFDSFFNRTMTRYERREVTLETEPEKMEVRSLPSEGRPEGFSGAIGVFTLQASRIPSKLNTGDPVAFNVTVNGQGTFDRMSAPTLEPAGLWKTYDPKEDFKGKDVIGFRGTKSFEIPAIAREPGTYDVAFSLPFFDPNSGEYQIARTQESPLIVTGDPLIAEVPATDATPPAPEDKGPLKPEIGSIAGNPTPLAQRTWFRATQGGLLTITALASLFLVIRNRGRDPQAALERALRDAIEEQRQKATTAMNKQNAPDFFLAVRSALSLQAAHLWGGNPEAITHADVLKHHAPESEVARIFATASALEYSGLEIENSSLPDWNRSFESALEELRNPAARSTHQSPAHWGQISQSA